MLAVAKAESHPLFGDIAAGSVRVDEVPASAMPGGPAHNADYASVAQDTGHKGDTIYLPTGLDITNPYQRSVVVHELQHAVDDELAGESIAHERIVPMKITDARVVVSSPGRNYVTLVIETDDGVTGIGDATLNGRELAVASYLRDHVCPLLIGRDSRRITDTWSYLYKGAYWRRGPVTMTAIAAVDVALWDIKGKVAGLPVYELLGGAAREGVMVYCHASGATLDELSADFQDHLDQGYLAIRAQAAIPGLEKTYGIARAEDKADGRIYEPASGNVPQEDTWETSAYLDFAPQVMAHLRAEFGYQVHLLHDVHHRLSPIEAGRLGAALEPYRMFWMEDPTPAEDQTAFRLIRQHTTTPIAVGRGLQQHLGLPAADHRAADRLHPHLGVPHRRDHPPATGLRPRRPVRGPLRFARSRRRVADRAWRPRCTWT